ncbi:MAG: dihydrofolate reductase family protein [Anaerolineae bacterium]
MDRPKVISAGAVSLDGRLTLAPDVVLLYGDARWDAVAGTSNLEAWLKLLHSPNAMLEGSNSLVPPGREPEPLPPYAGDPEALYDDFLPEEILARPDPHWFVLVDGRGRVRWGYKEMDGWHAALLVTRRTPPDYLAYLQRERIPYLVAGEGERVDLALGLAKMKQLLGVACVLSTSPGKLGGALLRAGLVDEVDVEIFPAIIGGTHTPALFTAPDLAADECPARLKLISAQVSGEGRVWLRYAVLREEG